MQEGESPRQSDTQHSSISHHAPEKATSDRRGKLVFLGVIAIVAILVYFNQRQPPSQAEQWPNDIDAAFKQAKVTNRRVLAFFMGDPPSQATRDMLTKTLAQPGNIDAIVNGKFIKVKIVLAGGLKSDLADQYKITSLPTMVIFDHNGNELNRRRGFIGELPFRRNFLSLETIEKP